MRSNSPPPVSQPQKVQRKTPLRNRSRSRSGGARSVRNYKRLQTHEPLELMEDIAYQTQQKPAARVQDDNLKDIIKVMDQMRKKIDKYEEDDRLKAVQSDKYNSLLIKYNALLF